MRYKVTNFCIDNVKLITKFHIEKNHPDRKTRKKKTLEEERNFEFKPFPLKKTELKKMNMESAESIDRERERKLQQLNKPEVLLMSDIEPKELEPPNDREQRMYYHGDPIPGHGVECSVM